MSGDLVEPGAREPRIGLWDHALAEPNLEDATFAHNLSGLARVPGLRAIEGSYRKKLRLKSWQYMTAATPEWFVAFVVGTAGFASNGFIYVVERATGTVHKRLAITPLGRGTSLAASSASGGHHFSGGGLAIDIANQDGGRRFHVSVETRTEGPNDADMPLRADLEFTSAPGDEHFAICTPLEERWNYTHKFGAHAVTGSLELGGRKIDMAGAFGTMDFTKSYALRHAVWKWLAVTGRTQGGAVFGINLIDPTPDAPVSENCAWLDGKRIPLADVAINVATPGDPMTTWAARAGQPRLTRAAGGGTAGATLELTGTPIAHVEQRLDVPVIKHRLLHVVTDFSGTLRLPDGSAHELVHVMGIAEDNDTWW